MSKKSFLNHFAVHVEGSRSAKVENFNLRKQVLSFAGGSSEGSQNNSSKDRRSFALKENSNRVMTNFYRYSFPLSPCSPGGKLSKTFSDVLNENIIAQRQEKRAVSLMPEILLHSAVLENNIEEILRLVKVDGIDVNRGTELGLFTLHQAAFSGLEEITEILVEGGADLKITTPEGVTALEAAVCAGNFECAEILIRNGAPVDSIRDGFVDRSFFKSKGRNLVFVPTGKR